MLRSNQEKRSVRTLIAITSEAGWPGFIRMARMRERLRGTGPRTTVPRSARLGARSARACPSQCTKRASVPVARGPVPRTRRSRRCILRSAGPCHLVSCCASIDIKVFQTFVPYAQAAPILQILFILAILLQTRRRNGRRQPPLHSTQKTRLLIKPTHHATQIFADFFDLVLLFTPAQRAEDRLIRLIF